MRCTQNKFTIFLVAYPYWVGSGHKSTDMLRIGSGQENLGSGRIGLQKSDPCPTLVCLPIEIDEYIHNQSNFGAAKSGRHGCLFVCVASICFALPRAKSEVYT